MEKIISRNPGAATRRIRPLRKRVRETPTTTASNLQPHFRFMDLPTEVQLQIYSYFSGVVLSTLSYHHQRPVRVTRRSLLLTSRQVNTAFAPIFYETAWLTIRAAPIFIEAAVPGGAGFPTLKQCFHNLATDLLCSPRVSIMMRLIRRLTIHAPFKRSESLSIQGFERGSSFWIINGKEWAEIGVFLQGCLRYIESLEVIEIYAHHSHSWRSNLPMIEHDLLRVCDPDGHANALFQKLRGSGHDAVIPEWIQSSHIEHQIQVWGPIVRTTISWWKLTFRKGSKMPVSGI